MQLVDLTFTGQEMLLSASFDGKTDTGEKAHVVLWDFVQDYGRISLQVGTEIDPIIDVPLQEMFDWQELSGTNKILDFINFKLSDTE